MTMKTEIDRICGIMYTLLEHQPVIDVPYEKINDIAVALVKEGYGDISEYKAEIERLRQEVRDTDKMARNTIEQYKNNYDNAFERLKAQEREIERLKAENIRLTTKLGQVLLSIDTVKEMNTMCSIDEQRRQAKIDVLNELREKYATSGSVNNNWATIIFVDDIDELIKEVKK